MKLRVCMAVWILLGLSACVGAGLPGSETMEDPASGDTTATEEPDTTKPDPETPTEVTEPVHKEPALPVCAPMDAALLAELPTRLADTGLYKGSVAAGFSDNVTYYAPRFPLWTDGSDKRRWFSVPGTYMVDNANPDFWHFPPGTKFWKEFAYAGVSVETRYLVKRSWQAGDWVGSAYVWNADQTQALAAPGGATDVLDTGHDVPSSGQCASCHMSTSDWVLGFSLVQLAVTDQTPSQMGVLDAAGLFAQATVTEMSLPGGAQDQTALGYLHGNCSHCHNTQRNKLSRTFSCFDPQKEFDLYLYADSLTSLDAVSSITTTDGIFDSVSPEDSKAIRRMRKVEMPPLGVRIADTPNIDLLSDWMGGL